MEKIERDELRNKLAAGWKVRRNSWSTGCYIASTSGADSCHWFDLLKDDWEGEPPEPRLRHDNKMLSFAVAYLKDGAAFIRRKNWKDERFEKHHAPFELSIDDILAADWEIWA